MAWFIYFLVCIVIFKLYNVITCGMCACTDKLTGKVVIVTGANSGIGFTTAMDLARRGARVILACRDDTRGKNAQNKIVEYTGNSDVEYKHLDLLSLASVRAFADNILKTEKRLDILINNAAASFLNQEITEDGLISESQVNHYGPFLLTNLLLPILKSSAPSRIINVSSIAHWLGSSDLSTLNKNNYFDVSFYCTTKLCNILFTMELSRRLEGTGVVVHSLHPGAAKSDINRNANKFIQFSSYLYNNFLFKDEWEGAQTTIYCAVAPECGNVTGQYYSDCAPQYLCWKAKNKNNAKKLWDMSVEAVKLEEKF